MGGSLGSYWSYKWLGWDRIYILFSVLLPDYSIDAVSTVPFKLEPKTLSIFVVSEILLKPISKVIWLP